MKLQRYKLIDVEFLLKMNEDEKEMMAFIMSEQSLNYVYPILSGHMKRRVDQSFVVFDLKGVSAMKIYKKMKPIFSSTSRIMSNFYPETLYRMVVINAGKIFYFVFVLFIFIIF